MNTANHDEFWRLYETKARRPIETACRRAAAKLSDGTMDPADLIAWVDTRVWRMLERGAWPTFHDDPSPEAAVDRIVDNAATLARWAYLGLSRKHWRRTEREHQYLGGMSRAERLAAVSTVGNGFEKGEAIKADLAKVRASLSDSLKAKLAASWPEKDERRRVAEALGATRPEDEELIRRTTEGDIKENTVQQMRSRARKRLSELFHTAAPALLIGAILLAIGAASAPAFAGEQAGGRKGGNMSPQASSALLPADLLAADGEQSGGRGGN